MKFWSLLKKELRELLTLQTLLGLLVGVVVFFLVGQFMSGIGNEMQEKMGSVVVADLDQSELTVQIKEHLKTSGFEVDEISGGTDAELVNAAKAYDHSTVLVIPEGFAAGIEAGIPQSLRVVSSLTSFGLISGNDSSASSAGTEVGKFITDNLIQQDGSYSLEFIKNPVSTADVTVVKGRSAQISASMVQSFAMQQTIFIPLVVFILITFASQLNISAIANEKGDKTLETLLSTPVPRLAVLGSKMCASGILSLLMAVVYMTGFSTMMGGMMGGMTGGMSGASIAEATAPMSDAMKALGLQLGAGQYLLIGIQLFLTIMIALAASMILGALSKDLKSANGLIAPLMFLAMIPYFVSIFSDVNQLPLVGQILMYLIPFTHTYTASANLLFGNFALFYGGMAYQIAVLALTLYMAVRVFSTDKIFTMTLEFKKKKKTPKIAKAG